jgi:hypothetical protein
MSYEFEPDNLTESFVDEIYEEAVESKTRFKMPVEVLGPTLGIKRSGEVYLDVSKIVEYSEIIDYMFGQMIAFHDKSTPLMTFKGGAITYLDDCWTKDVNTLLRIYALGIANGTISPFVLSKNGMVVAQKDPMMIPTLNTEDPEFPDWFENVYKKQYRPRHKRQQGE